MAPNPSIIVNCQRTHSNLLQIEAEAVEGVRLAFLKQTDDDSGECKQVGLPHFLTYTDYPELTDLVRVTPFDAIWDTDLLWSLATIHEDHLVTALGHYALNTDECWVADESAKVTVNA